MGIFLVTRNELIRSFKYKKKLVLTFLVPVFAVIVAIGVNSLMNPSINIGIIDNGSGQVYQQFKDKTNSISGLNIKYANKGSINTDMILGKYAVVIELNKDQSFVVTCLDSKFQENVNEIMKNYFTTGEVKGFEDILTKMESDSMTAAQRGGGFILLTLIITCTLAACNIIRDQQEGTLRRFLISPNKPVIYILGTFLYNFLSTIVQIVVSVGVLSMLPIDIGVNSMQLLLIGLIIAVVASSLSCLIVNLCKTELQASIIASVVALIMSLLGGSFLPLNKMPTVLKYISNSTITKWVIMFIGKIQEGVVSTATIAPIWIILGLSILMVIVACKLGERKFA
ncbi:ABC transporter permease [Clostridium manihotivorum]|uniref:ABC-2 type transporter transmembrane domain-containing protein n=1 Tax=Clostridium manihotivorum TaxID=2320868 RepID=A0A3R5THH8_9CLOT|nr:ABC transporter permease [Clostridium manihotivorum]QAA33580.1 hypothetical protein C1I91_19130 [Clostridium manihotivorum]